MHSWLYVIIMSRTSFRVNSHSIVCMNIKELRARSRRHIWSLSDSNEIRTHNHLVRKRTLNHLAKLAFLLLFGCNMLLWNCFEKFGKMTLSLRFTLNLVLFLCNSLSLLLKIGAWWTSFFSNDRLRYCLSNILCLDSVNCIYTILLLK